MTGAEVLIKRLETHGVEYIFGYSGGAAIPIFDAIATTETSIKLILTRHEQGAAHMADGYARASGKPGVVLVTSGPGAGNVVTGLMTAHMDSVPIIVISGQQIRPMLGLDAFQEADIFNITMPVTKHNYLLMDPGDIEHTVDEAFAIATGGRPGPVLIDIPKDVSSSEVSGHTSSPPKASTPRSSSISSKDVKATAKLLRTSKRPVILAGHGVLISGASLALREVSEQFNVPVVTTLLAKGVVDETSDMALGMLGMHGTAYANVAVRESDMILNIGSRFDDRIVGDVAAFAKGKTIVHVDIDQAEHGKIITPNIAILADAKQFLIHLQATGERSLHPKWHTRIRELKSTYPLKARPDTNDTALSQQEIFAEIDRQLQSRAIVTTDVGQHQMWAAQFMRTKSPDHWISSGGAGTMGFGLPSGIGAQLAKPSEPVIIIAGDGGFQMTLCELATAAIHKLPIKIFVMDNHYLGMVRQWQELFYDNRLSGVDMVGNPDFAALAESYGIKAFTVKDRARMPDLIKQAMEYNDGPVLMHCEVAKVDNVYPMIPAGRGYDTMLTEAPKTKLAKPVGST